MDGLEQVEPCWAGLGSEECTALGPTIILVTGLSKAPRCLTPGSDNLEGVWNSRVKNGSQINREICHNVDVEGRTDYLGLELTIRTYGRISSERRKKGKRIDKKIDQIWLHYSSVY